MPRIKQFLQTPVSSIPISKGQVVTISSSENIVVGFEKLLNNKILSAPVFCEDTGKYTGFLDIRDLISFSVFIYDSNIQAESLIDIVNLGVKMFKHPIDGVTVTYLSRRNPFHSIPENAPLQDAVNLLAQGIRRVPVVNANNKVVNIISQSTIIQFLQSHMSETEQTFDFKLSELRYGSAPVMTVVKTTRAIDVFRMMDHHKRSGVAVVDEEGVLVGNTSGRDLQLFVETPTLSVLEMPIMQFLNQIRSLNVDITVPVITVVPEDTFKLLIGKLAATRVHRIFVVDNTYRPTKIISIADVMKFIKSITQEK